MSSATYKHWVLNPKGARKIHVCAITNGNGETFVGHAICNPEDKYIAERGREIAQGRALKEYRSQIGGMKREEFNEMLNQRASDALKMLDEIVINDPGYSFGYHDRLP